jgi:hypothetical protein
LAAPVILQIFGYLNLLVKQEYYVLFLHDHFPDGKEGIDFLFYLSEFFGLPKNAKHCCFFCHPVDFLNPFFWGCEIVDCCKRDYIVEAAVPKRQAFCCGLDECSLLLLAGLAKEADAWVNPDFFAGKEREVDCRAAADIKQKL